MTDPVRNFYRQHAAIYQRLVARQDQHGNLLAALNEIRPLHGLQVVEFGAGTGNLTRLLSVLVNRVAAFGIEPGMLARAHPLLRDSGMTNWDLVLGDNARMPVASNCADLVIEGWSFASCFGLVSPDMALPSQCDVGGDAAHSQAWWHRHLD